MRNIEFVPKAFEEYKKWIETDRKTALRISDLIRDILRDPFTGIGKPEPLNHQFAGFWSRRIDSEHRLIYK
jgi:toxin YoeB